ncbi:MAG: hypothetical protein ACK5CA_15485, partial [Cyanobacteriota bacterium]
GSGGGFQRPIPTPNPSKEGNWILFSGRRRGDNALIKFTTHLGLLYRRIHSPLLQHLVTNIRF